MAANSRLRVLLAEEKSLECIFPPLKLCTDNGAMIAGLGYRYLADGVTSGLGEGASARVEGFVITSYSIHYTKLYDKAERRKLEREESRLLGEIDGAETALKALHGELSRPECYTDALKSRQVQAEITALEERIHELSSQWESISLQLEEKI